MTYVQNVSPILRFQLEWRWNFGIRKNFYTSLCKKIVSCCVVPTGIFAPWVVHAPIFFTTDMNRQHFNKNAPIMCNIVQFHDQRPYNEGFMIGLHPLAHLKKSLQNLLPQRINWTKSISHYGLVQRQYIYIWHLISELYLY